MSRAPIRIDHHTRGCPERCLECGGVVSGSVGLWLRVARLDLCSPSAFRGMNSQRKRPCRTRVFYRSRCACRATAEMFGMFSTFFVFERSGIVTSCRARFWRQLEPDFTKNRKNPGFSLFRFFRAYPARPSSAALGAVFPCGLGCSIFRVRAHRGRPRVCAFSNVSAGSRRCSSTPGRTECTWAVYNRACGSRRGGAG